MKLSVILPFRNAEATLGSAIQSILDQTFTDFELILIDNSSIDASSRIAESFLSDNRVSLIPEPNIGVVHTANTGLRASMGEYVARMDADDWSHPFRFELQINHLEEHPETDLVSGLVESIQKPTEGFQNYLDWVNSVTSSEEIRLNQFVEFPMVNPTIMFRRKVLDKVGYFKEGEFPEDYEYFLRMQSLGIKMTKVPAPILKWNDLPSRLTRTDDRYSEEAFNGIKSQYLASWVLKHSSFENKVWGDNTPETYGPLVEHCFDSLGTYNVDLSVVEPETKILFAQEHNIPVEIEPDLTLHIDTLSVSDEITFTPRIDGVVQYESSKYYWDFNNQKFISEENPKRYKRDVKTVRLLAKVVIEGEEYFMSNSISIQK